MSRQFVLRIRRGDEDELPPADYEGVSVPGSAAQWTVDPETEYLPWVGWGAIMEATYQGAFAEDHIAQVVDRFLSSGMTWMIREVLVGTVWSDYDAFTEWYDLGLPGSGPERQAYRDRRHWPLLGGEFFPNPIDLYMPMYTAIRAEAASRGIDVKFGIKVVCHDESAPPLGGDFVRLSDEPDLYGDIILAVWEHFNDTYGFVPDALDAVNEVSFTTSTAYNESETAAAIVNARGKLNTAGYDPIILAGSWQDPNRLANATHFGTFLDSDSGSWAHKWQPSSHQYGYVNPNVYSTLANIKTRLEAQSPLRGWIETEDINSVGLLVAAMERAHMTGNFWYLFAGEWAGADDRGTLFQLVGSGQLTARNHQPGKEVVMRAIRPGMVRVDAARSNISDSDHTHCAVFRHPATGRLAGVMHTQTSGARYIGGLPAGRYRVTHQVESSDLRKSAVGGDVTSLGSGDLVGVTYDVQAGQGIYLTEHQSDAAGVWAFVQEA